MSTDRGSASGEPEQQARWLRDESARADRQLTYAALDVGRRAFEQVANNEFGSGRQGLSLRPLGDTVEADTGRAIARYLSDLRQTLFDDPEEIFNGSETEQRFLVEFIPNIKTRELGKFVERVVMRAAESNPPTEVEVVDFLLKWITQPAVHLLEPFRIAVSTSEETAVGRWIKRLEGIEREFRRAIDTTSALESAREAASEAQRARDVAKQAAGQTGAIKLGDHFATVAARERRLASQWTAATIAAIVAVVGIGGLVLRQSNEAQQWTEALVHLAIVLPIIGLASYTARIARHHRMYARWSDTAAVQIESIAAFAEQLSEDRREQLIQSLGQSVFTSPAFSDDPRTEQISAIPADLVEALKALVEKLPRPGGSTN